MNYFVMGLLLSLGWGAGMFLIEILKSFVQGLKAGFELVKNNKDIFRDMDLTSAIQIIKQRYYNSEDKPRNRIGF